ncbi:branched-chain amino acid ABC transporter permease [Actinophytocola sp.]|uniref:branched-chain amino acid ABC transporter permease n=1 Tax=Actinophytocola sp. TaxID=1872138 RepID=UPI003D6AE96A
MTRALMFPACAVALVAAPFYLDVFQVGLVTRGLVWAVFGLSVWFLLRILNLPSFGHAAYFGIAAYVAGLAATRWDVGNVFAVLGLAVVVTCAVALPIAVVAARLGSVGFLLITLAFAEMLRALALRWRAVGGSDGLVGVVRPDAGPLPLELDKPVDYFYFTLGAAGLCLLLLWLVKRSALGGVLVGIRESEGRMRALGYRVGAYKVFAFALSAAIAAVAGVLHAYLIRFVSPEELGALVSARGLIIAVVAGSVLWAPVVVAVLLTYAEDVASSHTEHWLALMGLAYVAVALFGGRPPPFRLPRRLPQAVRSRKALITQEES